MLNSFYGRYGKRGLDIAGAVTLLCLFAPVMAIVAIAVRLTMGAPVVFRQPRIGRDEKQFSIFKFRSMSNACGKNGKLLSDVQRLTPVGHFLRASSLDELPQLWNILIGEMSFIGPRPLRIEYLPYYLPHERHRHDIRPGLTGLAQISGRAELDWDRRFQLDLEYLERQSLMLDISIAGMTFLKIFRRNGTLSEQKYISLYDVRQPQADGKPTKRAA